VLVYRIERKDNPYMGAFTGEDCAASAARIVAFQEGSFDPFDHPTPVRYPKPGEHCGFPHLDAYRTWFSTPAQRAALYADGHYHLQVYDVPDHHVHVELIQVLFDPMNATHCRDATPEEIA